MQVNHLLMGIPEHSLSLIGSFESPFRVSTGDLHELAILPVARLPYHKSPTSENQRLRQGSWRRIVVH